MPFLLICLSSEAARLPFLLRPLPHHLYLNPDVPVGHQFCKSVLLLLSSCRLKKWITLLKNPHWSHLLINGRKILLPRYCHFLLDTGHGRQTHAEFLCSIHWALLAFAPVIMEWTKEISTEAICGELHRRSELHSLISKLMWYKRRRYKITNKLLIKLSS